MPRGLKCAVVPGSTVSTEENAGAFARTTEKVAMAMGTAKFEISMRSKGVSSFHWRALDSIAASTPVDNASTMMWSDTVGPTLETSIICSDAMKMYIAKTSAAYRLH